MLPNGWDWSLWRYWGSLSAYLDGSFPLKEYLVCLITSAIPLFATIIAFQRKAY